MNTTQLIELMEENKDINLEEMLEIHAYIPIAEKRAIIEDLIDKTVSIEDGYLQENSVRLKILFDIAMVKYHTNLNIYDTDIIYDELHKILVDDITLFDFLLSCYHKDYDECYEMLNLSLENLRQQYSIEASVARMGFSISDSIKSLTEKLGNIKLEDILPSDIDADKLNTLLEKYAK